MTLVNSGPSDIINIIVSYACNSQIFVPQDQLCVRSRLNMSKYEYMRRSKVTKARVESGGENLSNRESRNNNYEHRTNEATGGIPMSIHRHSSHPEVHDHETPPSGNDPVIHVIV
jgi:hypothetical protein